METERKPKQGQASEAVNQLASDNQGVWVADLRLAAERVEELWIDRYGDVVNRRDLQGVLSQLVEALVGATNLEPLGATIDSVLGPRLLELMREQLVKLWSESADRQSVGDMLHGLDQIERLRSAMQPDWDQMFASSLAGPDGLALVVEVAHDLRSPLTSILFLAEMLQRGQSGQINEQQHRQLGLVYSAALGLSTVTSNVIELARGGSKLAEDDPCPFSVTEILESVRDIVRPMAEEKGLMTRLLAPTCDHRIGHPNALSRVLLNLTTNALKFTETGFVEIVAREKDLNIVEFSVRDSGPGISPEAVETLYLPFRRARGRDGYQFSGTGLGLALSRRLVEAMDSELAVETRLDWGTRFYFDLELRPTESS